MGLTRRRLLALCGATAGAAVIGCQEPPSANRITSTSQPSSPLTTVSPTATSERILTGARPFTPPVPTAIPAGALNVRAFGAVGDGVSDASRPINAAIAAAIAKGPGAAVLIPSGRYVLATATQSSAETIYTKADEGVSLGQAYGIRTHVLVRDATGLTIVGEPGTVLVMKDLTASGLRLEQCRSTVVSQIAIDYDPLPFTQGTVLDWDGQANTLDFRVDPGYLAPTESFLGRALAAGGAGAGGGFGNLFTTAGALKAASVSVRDVALSGIAALPNGAFRVQSSSLLRDVVKGDRFAWPARTAGGGQGFFLKRCSDCRVEFVTIHSAPGVAFVCEDSNATTFRGCVIDVPAGSGRLYSANADGIHCKSNRRGPVIEACRFTRQGDDSFTVVQLAQTLLATPNPSQLVVALDQYQLFAPGDRVAVIDQTSGSTRGEGVVRDVTLVRYRDRRARRIELDSPFAGLRSVESLGLSQVPAIPPDRATQLDKRPDLVVDLDMLGSGFIVRNNLFADHRGATRVHANDGLIENNRFERLLHAWLLIGMELIWPEVFDVRGLTIRNNTFVGPSSGPARGIFIRSTLGDLRMTLASAMGNQDITIEGNAFTEYGAAGAIRVDNARRIRIRGNSFGVSTSRVGPPVVLGFCGDITVEGNAAVQGSKPADIVATSSSTDVSSVTVQNNRELAPDPVRSFR